MESNLILKTEDIVEHIRLAPSILEKNELSASQCNAAGQKLMDALDAAGGISSDELDGEVKTYLEKVAERLKNMNKRRKPVTQVLSAIAKRFTSLEGEIDVKCAGTIPYSLQAYRNKYAAWKLDEQCRLEEEAKRRQMAEDEKVSYRDAIIKKLHAAYMDCEGDAVRSANALYSGVTLESFDRDLILINQQGIPLELNWTDLCRRVNDDVVTMFIDDAAKNAIKRDLVNVYRKQFARRFYDTMLELKVSLIEKLPSRRKALEEEAELRLRDAAEAARAETERLRRDAEETARAEAVRRQEEEARKVQIETEREAAKAMNVFDFMNATAPTGKPAKIKVNKKVQALNPKGFIELYQFWFMREGVNLPMEDLEKIHKKMISFCEKEANRDGGEMIRSAFIRYVDDVKAK